MKSMIPYSLPRGFRFPPRRPLLQLSKAARTRFLFRKYRGKKARFTQKKAPKGLSLRKEKT